MIKIYQDLLLKNGLNFMINKKEITMLRSGLCDFSDAYIVVKGTITVVRLNNTKWNRSVAFKNNAPFINCISKIDGVKIDYAEDLDVLIQCIIYLNIAKIIKKAGSLWNYYRDEPTNLLSSNSECFKYKQVLQEILIILVLVKNGMMQIKFVKMKLKLL